MTDTASDRTPTPQQEAAADWLLTLESGDPEARRAFKEWLAADERNREAWEQIAHAWRCIGETSTPQEHHAAKPHQSRAGRSRPVRTAACSLAAAIVLTAVLVALAPVGADYRTGSGETLRVELVDGSVLRMAPESRVSVALNDRERSIELLSGQAYFDVARDRQRPFRVHAGGAQATVLGTRFDVRLTHDEVAVGVREGRVRFEPASGQSRAEETLRAGGRLVFSRTRRTVQRNQIPPDDVASWIDGRLFVDGATVTEAVDRLEPYHDAWIVIASDELGSRRVTGSFDLDRPDEALAALVSAHEGQVRRITPYLRVLSMH
jgi:transmembrane sensor